MGNQPTQTPEIKRGILASVERALGLKNDTERIEAPKKKRVHKVHRATGILAAITMALGMSPDVSVAENDDTPPVKAGEKVCYGTEYAEAGDFSFQNVTDIQIETGNYSFSNLHPVSTPDSQRLSSSLTNTTPGGVNPNTGLVLAEELESGEPGSCVSVLKDSHIAVDELASIDGDYVEGGVPKRVLDTRDPDGPTSGQPVKAGEKVCYGTEYAEAGDFSFQNVTDIQIETGNYSFSNLHPVSTPDSQRLSSSLTNTTPGGVNPNTGLVRLEADDFGEILGCVSSLADSHVAVDQLATIDGSIVKGGTPVRLEDTRYDDIEEPLPGEQGVTVSVYCNAQSVGDGVQEKQVRVSIAENEDIYDRFGGGMLQEGELQDYSSSVDVAFEDGSVASRPFEAYYDSTNPSGSFGFSYIHSANDKESPSGATDQPDPIGFDIQATLKNGNKLRKVVTGLDFKTCNEYNPGEAQPQVIVNFEF